MSKWNLRFSYRFCSKICSNLITVIWIISDRSNLRCRDIRPNTWATKRACVSEISPADGQTFAKIFIGHLFFDRKVSSEAGHGGFSSSTSLAGLSKSMPSFHRELTLHVIHTFAEGFVSRRSVVLSDMFDLFKKILKTSKFSWKLNHEILMFFKQISMFFIFSNEFRLRILPVDAPLHVLPIAFGFFFAEGVSFDIETCTKFDWKQQNFDVFHADVLCFPCFFKPAGQTYPRLTCSPGS